MLGVKFGCAEIVQLAKKILNKYIMMFLKALPPVRRKSTRFDSPAFWAASFYLAAELKKLKILNCQKKRSKENLNGTMKIFLSKINL